MKTISDDVLLLPNTVPVKRAEDYIRGCSTSTKYCPPLTSWRLYQRVFYFYQILSPLNKLKTISESVLLLPNTVSVKRTEDYIRGCSTSTKYCPLTGWRLYQRVFYFYQILSPLNELKTISEGVLLLPNTVTLKQVEDYIRGCSTSTKYCPPLTSWRLSEGGLLLPNTVTLKQVEDYIRGCSTSTKYCHP